MSLIADILLLSKVLYKSPEIQVTNEFAHLNSGDDYSLSLDKKRTRILNLAGFHRASNSESTHARL